MIVHSWWCRIFGHDFWAGVIRSRSLPDHPAYGFNNDRVYSHQYRRCDRCGLEQDC